MTRHDMNSKTAVLLIAHGSRREAANADLADLASRVRDRGVYDVVEIAYLEIVEPTIPQGVERCLEQSPERVLMMPYFLSAGSHVVEDLERFRREAVAKHPHVTFELCPPLGLDALIVDLVMKRLGEGGESP